VYLAARSEAKANAAIEKLYEENQNLEKGKVVFLPLDLADLDHVVKAAEIFLGHEDRLDILGTSNEPNRGLVEAESVTVVGSNRWTI
jgi:NAD(P)-dependent dehydrogenase (short-subunit alcohol dehydrogenase family)